MNRQITVFPTVEALKKAAVEIMIGTLNAAVEERGVSVVALSGGETPRDIYALLGTSPRNDRLDWKHVHVFFGDERMVKPTDARSNYGMVRSSLFSGINIPDQNVHRIHGEQQPEEAARAYADELRTVLGRTAGRFDLVMLGLGEDGHTASLFPGTDALHEMREQVRAVPAPGTAEWRVTLTLPVINNAREVLFLVTGANKAAIVGRVLNATQPSDELPASFVRPEDGNLLWFMDRDAAAGRKEDR